MASIRPCNKCGEKISIRQMPHQQWVAFNVGTDDPHKCLKKNLKKNQIKLNKTQKKGETFSIKENENLNYDEPNFVEDEFYKEQEEIENLKNLKKISSQSEINENENNLFKNPLFIAIIFIIFLAIFVYP